MKAALFDLDGTLIDSSYGFCQAINDVLDNAKLARVTPEWVRQRLSGGARGMLSECLQLASDHEEVTRLRHQFLDTYLANHITSQVRLFDGIAEVLNWLASQQVPWGIVTNKPEMLTTPTLAHLGLASNCQVTICPDHVVQVKPDPQGIELACQTLGLTPGEVIYVGDHRKDIEAAHRSGSRGIACQWGFFRDDDPPSTWQADWLAKHPTDLITIFSEQHHATLA